MTRSQLIIHNIKTNFRRDYNKRLQVCTYTQEFTRGKDPATAMASRPSHRQKAEAIVTRFHVQQYVQTEGTESRERCRKCGQNCTREFARGKGPATAMASRPSQQRKAKGSATRFCVHQQDCPSQNASINSYTTRDQRRVPRDQTLRATASCGDKAQKAKTVIGPPIITYAQKCKRLITRCDQSVLRTLHHVCPVQDLSHKGMSLTSRSRNYPGCARLSDVSMLESQ